MSKETFDDNGFPTNRQSNRRAAKKVGIPVEQVEVLHRSAIRKIARTLRGKGYDIPTDPKAEAEWISEFAEEALKDS